MDAARFVKHPPSCGCSYQTYRIFCKHCHARKTIKLPGKMPLEEIAANSRCGFCESVGQPAKIIVSEVVSK